MTSKPCSIVVLCEDRAHESVIRAYLKKCDVPSRRIRWEIASRKREGGNDQDVAREFQVERVALRTRPASARLVAMVDADNHTTRERREFLLRGLPQDAGTALLIPKRNIESWIRAVCSGESIDEAKNFKHALSSTETGKLCGEEIHAATRNEPWPQHWPPSLLESLPDWRRLG